jgi:hypothetical protein
MWSNKFEAQSGSILITGLSFLKMSICFTLFLLACSSCTYDYRTDFFETDLCNTNSVSYSSHIKGIMERHCVSCHGSVQAYENIRLDSYEEVLTYAQSGALTGSIMHEPGYEPMPTADLKIPECEIELIKIWIDEGMSN